MFFVMQFWSELSIPARQKLLRIDKHSLFEQARKNMYCSRCNGLLLEGFMQIVIYGKSLQQDAGANAPSHRLGATRNQTDGVTNMITECQDEMQDPGVHSWGGLTTTREGSLTLLDCYLCSKSLSGLQNVFDSARARERERELLYPDACGGGGRGWMSQEIATYSRGHGNRETCALHTARLSCDTLVDFWSALGEDTRQSLLRMKEEDFIERLMYRFDSKRFCRDCRRNVIREFKELKELKRMRRETRCTSWFCGADTSFQYEVSDEMVHADWHQTCFITLRAWKMDGRCTELSVKAHALKGQQCVHCRLIVGDGFVTITRGDSIRSFFEHAEEAEEEEDDDSMEKDGNELDGECSRPQKHAKSPELAREFLLDAATVEKAFREGTARQNAHSIFVCLALNLLEERIHVACKEIITLEKQMKLLEEEEKEKREEEERKERRRLKEREKKLRRKERLKGKERGKDTKSCESNDAPLLIDAAKDESSLSEELNNGVNCRDSVSEAGDNSVSSPGSPNTEEQFSNGCTTFIEQNDSYDCLDGEVADVKDGSGSFPFEQSKSSRRRLKLWKEVQMDSSLRWSDRRGPVASRSCSRNHSDNIENSSRSTNGSNRQSRISGPKSTSRTCGPRFSEKFNGPNNRITERHDSHSCSCIQTNEYRAKVGRDGQCVCKMEPEADMHKQFYRGNKHNQADYTHESCGRPRNKVFTANSSGRDAPHVKKVWEPMESQKKYPRSNSDSDFSKSSGGNCFEVKGNSDETDGNDCKMNDAIDSNAGAEEGFQDQCSVAEVNSCPPNGSTSIRTSISTSNSDNSSCVSEGDSNTASSNHGNLESSSTSDSEDASQQSEGRGTSLCNRNGFSEAHDPGVPNKQGTSGQPLNGMNSSGVPRDSPRVSITGDSLSKPSHTTTDNGVHNVSMGSQHHGTFTPLHNQNLQYPVVQAPSTMSYYHQSPVSWPTAAPAMPFHQPNHYLYAGSLGYGLNGNSHLCMPYTPMQHVTTPVFNPSQQQQPVAEAHAEKRAPGRKIDNFAKLNTGNEFSLFQFGWPPSGDVMSKVSAADQIGNYKRETIGEEYNLFASSNGLKFSFF
ncbi:hypothetical protein LINPERHAP1_LOCUS12332 [Linum perenne]